MCQESQKKDNFEFQTKVWIYVDILIKFLCIIQAHFSTKLVVVAPVLKQSIKDCQTMVLQLHQIWRQPKFVWHHQCLFFTLTSVQQFLWCDHLQLILWQFCKTSLKYFAADWKICFAKYFTSLLNNSQRIAGLQHCNISQDNLLCLFLQHLLCLSKFRYFFQLFWSSFSADNNPDRAAQDCPSAPTCKGGQKNRWLST